MKTWSDDRGSSTLAVTAAAGFALAVFVLLANLVVLHYVRGVARTAVDEAVRQAAVHLDSCVSTAEAVLDELVGGVYGSGLEAYCEMTERQVSAMVSGSVPSLIPLVPAHDLAVVAMVVRPDA